MVVPVLVAPDAVGIVMAALEPLGVPIANRTPNPRPEAFVRVFQIGGHRINLVQHARTVRIEALSQTNHGAWQMAEEAASIVSALEGRTVAGASVHRVDLFTAPIDQPDPDTSQHRFHFSAQLYLRALEA